MVRMRAAPIPIRLAWAALFALLLTVRSLAPAGFMPAFDHGSLTIVACPDVAPTPPMRMHGHGDHKVLHEPCPYASASALGALGPDWTPFVLVTLFGTALLLGRTLLSVGLRDQHDRPPATGPPIPA